MRVKSAEYTLNRPTVSLLVYAYDVSVLCIKQQTCILHHLHALLYGFPYKLFLAFSTAAFSCRIFPVSHFHVPHFQRNHACSS